MPEEIFELEEFLQLVPFASECRVKTVPRENTTKVKLRTRRKLYTYKIETSGLRALLDQIRKINKDIRIENL